MSPLHTYCPNCGFTNDAGVESCHHCGQPLHPATATKGFHKQGMSPQSVRRKISRRTVLVGIAAGAVALPVIGGVAYLASTKRPDPHRLLTYSGNSGYAMDAAWSPDGTRVASIGSSTSGTSSPQLQVWNATTGKRLLTDNLEADVLPRLVVWSADGQHLLVFVDHSESLPSGSQIVDMVQIWDAATGQRMRTIPVMQPVPLLNSGALSEQPRLIAGALNEQYLAMAKSRYDAVSKRDATVIEIWEIATGREIATLDPTPSPTATLQSGSTPAPLFAPSDGTPTPTPSPLNTPTPTNTSTSHDGSVSIENMAWAPESGKLAVCTASRGLSICQIWDAPVGKKMHAFGAEYQTDSITAWSLDGRFIALGTVVYDVETGHRVAEYTVEGRLQAQSWSPDGTRLAVRSSTRAGLYAPTYGMISIIDASNGRQVAQYDEGEIDPRDSVPLNPSKMGWSPNGKEILVVQNTGIDIWRAE